MSLFDFMAKIEKLIENKLEEFALKHGLVHKGTVVAQGAATIARQAEKAVDSVADTVKSVVHDVSEEVKK